MYIDDILIYSKTEEEYIELVRCVLQKLTENNLCINIDKCLFHIPEVDLVGFQVGKQRIQMSQKKVEDIVNWPAPRNVCHGVTTGPPKGTCTIQNNPRICYTCIRNT